MVIADFVFASTPKIHFGAGSFCHCGRIVASFGKRAILVTGKDSLKKSGRLEMLCAMLKAQNIDFFTYQVTGEPSPDFVDLVVAEHRKTNIEVVLAVGGGSVLDAGKAISAMLPHGGTVVDYLEVVGNKEYSGIKVPFVAVPTTAGTGSEATKNTVLSRIGPKGFKRSLRHDSLIPNTAIVDPELSMDSPVEVKAACGMDAFTQLLESYVSPNSSPLTDTIAYSGIEVVKDHLIAACSTGSGDIHAATGMAYASLLSGISLANAGLGIVHGLAAILGGKFAIPHGIICGTLLGAATQVNIEVLQQKHPSHPALTKYAKIGILFGGENREQSCQILVEKIADWISLLRLPTLFQYGVREGDIDDIATQTVSKTNAIHLHRDEIRKILLLRWK